MVTDDPVCVRGGGSHLTGRGNLALVDVPQTLEQTLSKVHVTDWVDALGELD